MVTLTEVIKSIPHIKTHILYLMINEYIYDKYTPKSSIKVKNMCMCHSILIQKKHSYRNICVFFFSNYNPNPNPNPNP